MSRCQAGSMIICRCDDSQTRTPPMPDTQAAAVAPRTASPTWNTGRTPDFWSIVAHAGLIYARTEAGIVWWDDSNRLWCSVKRNPFDVYCMGLAAGPTAAQPIYALEGNFLFLIYDGCRDRKSTRLNSSHGYISYSLFFF